MQFPAIHGPDDVRDDIAARPFISPRKARIMTIFGMRILARLGLVLTIGAVSVVLERQLDALLDDHLASTLLVMMAAIMVLVTIAPFLKLRRRDGGSSSK